MFEHVSYRIKVLKRAGARFETKEEADRLAREIVESLAKFYGNTAFIAFSEEVREPVKEQRVA